MGLFYILHILWRNGVEDLQLASDEVTGKESCYPSKEESRNLAKGNNWFFWNNLSFSFILGVLYGIAILLLSIPPISNVAIVMDFQHSLYLSPWISVFYSPSFFVVLVILLSIGILYALKDDEYSKKVLICGVAHGLLQFLIISIFAVIFKYICNGLYGSPLGFEIGSFPYIIALILVALIGGLVGNTVWGWYLAIVSYYWGLQSNDAFSSMRLTSYKNFLRLHFKNDTLTIYPLGLKTPPSREKWKKNKNFGQTQYEPKYICSKLELELIETPIVISEKNIT